MPRSHQAVIPIIKGMQVRIHRHMSSNVSKDIFQPSQKRVVILPSSTGRHSSNTMSSVKSSKLSKIFAWLKNTAVCMDLLHRKSVIESKKWELTHRSVKWTPFSRISRSRSTTENSRRKLWRYWRLNKRKKRKLSSRESKSFLKQNLSMFLRI